jgi:predicted molibdopterin-dependent oxidoreductase YjgC
MRDMHSLYSDEAGRSIGVPGWAWYTRRERGKRIMNRYARLTEPLVRDGGKLRVASWDEALERAAQAFRSGYETHGPSSFGLFSCSKATNEMNFVAQKFARVVMGSNNIDSCNRT